MKNVGTMNMSLFWNCFENAHNSLVASFVSPCFNRKVRALEKRNEWEQPTEKNILGANTISLIPAYFKLRAMITQIAQ